LLPFLYMISVSSHDGREFNAYLALPAAGRGPGVVVLQEVFGVNRNMRAACDWFAARGFVALCPDLFWRIEPGVELGELDHEKAMELYGKLDVKLAADDAGAALDFLRAHPACNGRVGTVGYCLGGLLSFLVARSHGCDAAVSYYGVGIEKSLDASEKLASPLMLHIAALDKYSPPAVIEQILEGLASHPGVAIHIYPNSDHAFARPDGAHYDPDMAELANLRTLDFLTRHLSPKYSLEAIWGEHIEHEFATRDTERTLATMVDDA
jgi:carboxymethylenebutenolidase